MQKHISKILIIGAGSIGQRHSRNLSFLGYKNVFFADPKKETRATFSDYKDALNEHWDAVFICVPPVFNIEIASRFVDKKTPLFIEKPLSNNLRGVNALIKKVYKYNVPVMVGYNLRFHPLVKKAKDILIKNALGKIYGVRSEMGQYLPDWHPWEDYRRGYSANKNLGGGIVLDSIHEIDYMCWMFGEVKKAYGLTKKISNLEINTEDYAEIILEFQNGVIGQIHMDYLQRVPSRSFKIIGEKGTLICDIRNSELKYFFVKDKKWHSYKLKNFDYNQTYIDEVKYFMDCSMNNKIPDSDIINGYKTLKTALNAKK